MAVPSSAVPYTDPFHSFDDPLLYPVCLPRAHRLEALPLSGSHIQLRVDGATRHFVVKVVPIKTGLRHFILEDITSAEGQTAGARTPAQREKNEIVGKWRQRWKDGKAKR